MSKKQLLFSIFKTILPKKTKSWRSKVLISPLMIYAPFNSCQNPQECLTLDDAPSESQSPGRVWDGPGPSVTPHHSLTLTPPTLAPAEDPGSDPRMAPAPTFTPPPSDHHPLHPHHPVGSRLWAGRRHGEYIILMVNWFKVTIKVNSLKGLFCSLFIVHQLKLKEI